MYVELIPFADKLYEENIVKFYTDYIKLIQAPANMCSKSWLNYMDWYIRNNRFVANHYGEKVNYEHLYSYELLTNKVQEIQQILKEVLNFTYNEEIQTYMENTKFNFKTFNDIDEASVKLILGKIYNFCIDKRHKTNNNIHHVKNFYLELMIKLSTFNNAKFEGFFLNEDGEFKPTKELFYIVDDNISTILEDGLKKKNRTILRVPDPEDPLFGRFIKMCRNSGLHIYDKSDITYENKLPRIDDELKAKILHILSIYNSFNEINVSDEIKKLRFYSCSEIYFKAYSEKFTQGICYYDKKCNCIYYLKDDVYTSWEHPTVQFYIAEFLTNILKIKDKHAHFITLLRLKCDQEIRDWINNKTFI
jgi:hypothetical protein